jgi:DNA-binding Lrp family transcriptional regulator
LPEVTTIHTTNGRWDLVVEVATDTLESLDAVLRRIRLIDGIAQSVTNLYLASRRSSG